MNIKSLKFLVFCFLFVLAASGSLVVPLKSSNAQVTQPTTVEPGQIERQFDERLKPRVEPDEIVEPLADVEEGGDDEITFTLNGLTVSGNEVINEEGLAPAYEEYIGTDVTFATLNKIAAKITAIYKEEGYILARAYIPPQKVADGIVEMKVVEGFIDKVDIEGEVEGSRALLDAFIMKIRRSKPLKADVLERYMLLMDDLPGVTARGLLRPSEETVGAADLVINIKHERTKTALEVNNRGTKFLGPYQFSSIVRANSWLGVYDRAYVRFVTTNQTEELQFLDVYYAQPIGHEGGTVSGSVIRSTSQPGSTLKTSLLDSESLSIGFEYSHPIIRAREENLFLRAGVTYRETVTDTDGARLTADSVRVVRIGGQYDKVDPWDGVNLIDLEVSQGLDIWKATNRDALASRTNAEVNFHKVVANVSRYQPLSMIATGMGVSLSGTGQYSSGSMFASEEIGIGGSQFGSAYDPSEISGDHGAAGKFELQYGKYMGLDYLASFQAYSFFDGGVVWNEDVTSGEADRATLSSVGAGVRLYISDDVTGSLEVAFPLHRKVASEGVDDEHDPRAFFSLVRNF